jgi:hypothetical protein
MFPGSAGIAGKERHSKFQRCKFILSCHHGLDFWETALRRKSNLKRPFFVFFKDIRDAIPSLHGALLKNEQDVHLFERLAFMARRES